MPVVGPRLLAVSPEAASACLCRTWVLALAEHPPQWEGLLRRHPWARALQASPASGPVVSPLARGPWRHRPARGLLALRAVWREVAACVAAQAETASWHSQSWHPHWSLTPALPGVPLGTTQASPHGRYSCSQTVQLEPAPAVAPHHGAPRPPAQRDSRQGTLHPSPTSSIHHPPSRQRWRESMEAQAKQCRQYQRLWFAARYDQSERERRAQGQR